MMDDIEESQTLIKVDPTIFDFYNVALEKSPFASSKEIKQLIFNVDRVSGVRFILINLYEQWKKHYQYQVEAPQNLFFTDSFGNEYFFHQLVWMCFENDADWFWIYYISAEMMWWSHYFGDNTIGAVINYDNPSNSVLSLPDGRQLTWNQLANEAMTIGNDEKHAINNLLNHLTFYGNSFTKANGEVQAPAR